MSFNVNTTLSEAQALLNDPSGSVYTNTKCMPFLRRAYEELQNNLQLNDVPIVLDRSAAINVTAGVLTVPATTLANMILPIWLEERTPGDSEIDWSPMTPMIWEPNRAQVDFLGVWVWREETIYLLGSTAAREVRVTYLKSLPTLVDQESIVYVSNANNFLASKTAASMARMIKKDFKLAEILDLEAGRALSLLISLSSKGRQLLPVRRLPFGTTRRLALRRY